jgi:hypothetical protein
MNGNKGSTVLVGGIVMCFVVVVLACTAVYLADPGGDNVAGFITPILGFTGTTLALLATLHKLNQTDEKVDYLANGGTDAKIRAGIADVVRPELLKPEAGEQLEADRAHRDASPANGGNGNHRTGPGPGTGT